MSDKPHMTYVDGDDWKGLYRNGRLVAEGHSIPATTLLRESGVLFGTFSITDEGDEGGYPANLGDIPREVRV